MGWGRVGWEGSGGWGGIVHIIRAQGKDRAG